MNHTQRRQAVIFPKEREILQQLGENIRLAMKRRRVTQTMIAERTGLSKPTLRKIEHGESTVSIGHYLRVLAVLGLAEDLARVALDDDMGRKLQDIELLKSARPGNRSGSRSADRPLRPKPAASADGSKSDTSRHIESLMALAKARSLNEGNEEDI